MSAVCPAPSDHGSLESDFAEVVAAIESGIRARIENLWTAFEQTLLAHFELEERTMVADLMEVRPRQARILLEEHRYLRGRLAQLGATLPAVPVQSARTFLDELRAHGRHEDRVLYPWAASRRGMLDP